jgi:hypothetical protein
MAVRYLAVEVKKRENKKITINHRTGRKCKEILSHIVHLGGYLGMIQSKCGLDVVMVTQKGDLWLIQVSGGC